MPAFTVAIKAFAARSILRDQLIMAMAGEIIHNMMEGSHTLVLEDIDDTKA